MAAKFVLLSFFICAAAAQQIILERPFIEILRAESAGPGPDGSYAFSFEDSAGAKREEVSKSTGPNTFAVQGAYSYTNDDGSVVEVLYRADENGVQVESPSLPQAPPMPQHAIEQLEIAEELRRQGVIFDQRGFVVEQGNRS